MIILSYKNKPAFARQAKIKQIALLLFDEKTITQFSINTDRSFARCVRYQLSNIDRFAFA